jgi:hypothetical protein
MSNFSEELEEIDKRVAETMENMKKTEEEGLQNTLKHFDRIHDKLFDFNNILIAGYFALSAIKHDVPIKSILIPIINMLFLIFIEYRMMEKSRFQSDIRNKRQDEITKWGKGIAKTNLYSLFIIITTFVVIGVFLWYAL